VKKVYITDSLYTKIEEKIVGTSFKSVDDFVIAKLREVFPEDEKFSESDQEIIRERLRKLGYLQ